MTTRRAIDVGQQDQNLARTRLFDYTFLVGVGNHHFGRCSAAMADRCWRDYEESRNLRTSRLNGHFPVSLLCRSDSRIDDSTGEIGFPERPSDGVTTRLRKYDVQANDTDDLVQEVLLAVSKDVRKFEHSGQPGAFRAWLKAILVNRLRKSWRVRDRRPGTHGDSDIDTRLAQLDDPSSERSLFWNHEHAQYVLRQLLLLAEPHFEPTTWRAFCRVALDGVKPDIAAEELGISRNAVIVAKCRALNRLRQESEGLIESASGFFARS